MTSRLATVTMALLSSAIVHPFRGAFALSRFKTLPPLFSARTPPTGCSPRSRRTVLLQYDGGVCNTMRYVSALALMHIQFGPLERFCQVGERMFR